MASAFKIVANEGDAEPFKIAVKRFYLPVVVEGPCPNCGERVCTDLSGSYLSYPVANETFDLDMYCGQDGGCEHEWTIPVRLSLSLTIVED